MQLVVGTSYEVLDWLGTVFHRGKYVGRVKNINGPYSPDPIFLFEMEDKGCYKLSGCQLKCHVNSLGIVDPYLHITHCGNNLEDFNSWGITKYVPPKWEMV